MKNRRVRQPVFIVGCGRSGTRVLFDTLSQHPKVANTDGYPDGEDHVGWINHGKCIMAGVGNVHNTDYGNGINGVNYCLHMTEQDVTSEIIEGMSNYYFDEVLKKDSSKTALNKNPHLSNKLDYVLEIFPDAKIIHIVRDCKPVVASWIALMNQHPLTVYWPREEKFPCFWLMPKSKCLDVSKRLERHENFYPGGGEDLWVDYWCKTNLGILEQMKKRNSQLLTVKYEDFVVAPNKTLNYITDFCNLSEHKFNIDNIKSNTDTKYSSLISQQLEVKIFEQAESTRKLLGY